MLTRRSLFSMLSAGIASVAVSTRLAASELRVVEPEDAFTRWLEKPDSEWFDITHMCKISHRPGSIWVELPSMTSDMEVKTIADPSSGYMKQILARSAPARG